MISVDEKILFYAFRYAIERMTYVPGEVGANIIYNKESISALMRKRIIHEIREKEYKNELGMETDKQKWLKVKEELLKYNHETMSK